MLSVEVQAACRGALLPDPRYDTIQVRMADSLNDGFVDRACFCVCCSLQKLLT